MDVELYNRFAHRYDLVTTIASFGIEPIWRLHFSQRAKQLCQQGTIVDVASATGEVAKLVCCSKTYLIDPSSIMMEIARKKLEKKCPHHKFFYLTKRAEEVEISESVDLISAFMAVRNFDNLERGIANLARYLKKGGYFYIVEIVNQPNLLGKLTLWYLKKIVPKIGKVLTGMEREFYLLGESVEHISAQKIVESLERVGLEVVEKGKMFPPIGISILARRR